MSTFADTLCRVCLSVIGEDLRGNTKHGIFLAPGLLEMFQECTSLSLQPKENLPKYLCEVCLHNLTQFYCFRLMCIHATPAFYAIQQKQQFNSVVHSPSVELLLNDENSVLDVNSQINLDITVKEQQQVTVNMGEQPLVELQSDAIARRGSALTAKVNHEYVRETKICKENKAREHKNLMELNTTDVSKITFNKFENYTPLIDSNCWSRVQEGHAKDPVKSSCTLTKHLKQVESVCTSFPCQELGCSRVYTRKNALSKHMRKHHNLGKAFTPIVCKICGKVFTSKSSLRNHHFTHKNKYELPNACDYPHCNQRFIYASNNYFICNYCGTLMTTLNEFNAHMNSHML